MKGVNPPKAKKYKTDKYGWKSFKITRGGKKISVEYLVELATGERVIANPRVAGKPRLKAINGQDIYSGNTREHVRNKVMEQIKKEMLEHLKDMAPITKFPINIRIIMYDAFHDPDIPRDIWDVGNRMWPYQKAFEDVLQDLKIIPDDDRKYVTAPPAPIYTPVDTPEERKLIFRIYRDDRKEIKESKYYKHFFDETKK